MFSQVLLVVAGVLGLAATATISSSSPLSLPSSSSSSHEQNPAAAVLSLGAHHRKELNAVINSRSRWTDANNKVINNGTTSTAYGGSLPESMSSHSFREKNGSSDPMSGAPIAGVASSSSASSSFTSTGSSAASSSNLQVDPSTDTIRFPLYLRCTATTICLLLLFCGCPGNLLVPYVVLKTKDLRNSTNIFLINLSVSDLLILLITSPTVLIELHSQPEVWFLGLFMCKAVSFIEICVAHASILTILAISFERFYAICRPLQAGYKCTKRRAFVIILLIWIIALSSTLPMIWITELQEVEYMDGSIVPVCVNTLQNGWHPVYYIVVFVLFFVTPFVILVILYAMISKKLTSDSKSIPNLSNFKRRLQVRRQVVLMLASVCITFFICLLPFRLMTLWIITSTQEEVYKIGMETYYNLLFVCRLLLYVNSSINPILYNLISCKFRAAFCRILKVDLRSRIVKTSLQAKDSCISERFSNTIDRSTGNNNQTTTAYSTIITTTNAANHDNNTLTVTMKQHSYKSAVPVDVHSL